MALTRVRRSLLGSGLIAALVTLTGLGALVALAPLAAAAPGDGSASGVEVNVTPSGASPVMAGPLAPASTAGSPIATQPSATVSGIVTTSLLTSSAVFDPTTGEVHSGSTAAGVAVPLLSSALGAVTATSLGATCAATPTGVSGAVTVTGLSLGTAGTPASNPAPNTVLTLGAGIRLTLNEQASNADGSLTVTAFDLSLDGSGSVGVGEVRLASATCGPARQLKASPTISTAAAPASAVLGTGFTDTAILGGGLAPTGVITFSIFGPDDANCTAAPVTTSTIRVDHGDGSYRSAPFSPTAPGVYRFVASYGGDPANIGVGAVCNDPGGTFTAGPAGATLTARASASAMVGGLVLDNAALNGGHAETGKITFRLYGPDDPSCSRAPVDTSTAVVAGDGSYQSALFTPARPGTYRYLAAYSGDPGNAAATGGCGAAGQAVLVTPVGTTPPGTTPAGSSALGSGSSGSGSSGSGSSGSGSSGSGSSGSGSSAAGSGSQGGPGSPVSGQGSASFAASGVAATGVSILTPLWWGTLTLITGCLLLAVAHAAALVFSRRPVDRVPR